MHIMKISPKVNDIGLTNKIKSRGAARQRRAGSQVSRVLTDRADVLNKIAIVLCCTVIF